MTPRVRVESSLPRGESMAPWLFIVRRFMRRAPRGNGAIHDRGGCSSRGKAAILETNNALVFSTY